MSKMAVIVSDMINDFFHEKGTIATKPHIRRIVPNVARLCEEARKRNIPVIFCGDSLPEKSPEFDIWPRHGLKGTWGAKFIKELGEPTEYVEKSGFSPFYGTRLLEVLRKLKVDILILCGICCEVEIKNIAFLAAIEPGIRDPERPELGYKIVIPSDCVCHCGSAEGTFRTLEDIEGMLKQSCGSMLEVTTVYDLMPKLV